MIDIVESQRIRNELFVAMCFGLTNKASVDKETIREATSLIRQYERAIESLERRIETLEAEKLGLSFQVAVLMDKLGKENNDV